MTAKLHGLVAATHTPFTAGGDLNLAAVARQAEHLAANGVKAVFVGGTTGECSSLTVDERLSLVGRWADVLKGSPLKLVVHVGSNCLADARALAKHAESVKAAAISALSPSYFKPRTMDDLIACCADVAAAAPGTPFYFYDIPSMTGVSFPMPAFLAAAPAKVPTLAGLKFTNVDQAAYVRCLQFGGGRFDIPWGVDEHLLGGLAAGAQGAVGSTYNFAAPIYVRLMAAFARGDLPAARVEQDRSVRLIEALAALGYMAAAKTVMGFLGVDVGPARLPSGNLSAEQKVALKGRLEEMGFFSCVGI